MKEKTWQELGMKPGIQVPGTASWMAKWWKNPNQKEMIEYAREVNEVMKTMSEENVIKYIQKYLSGKWDPKDEAKIAAAMRRRPIWLGKYNLMEESIMAKKQEEKRDISRRKARENDLEERVTALEEEVDALNKALRYSAESEEEQEEEVEKPEREKEDRKEKKIEKGRKDRGETSGDTGGLLKDLEAANKAGNRKAASKIRAKLRKAGYSLRDKK